MNTRELAEKSLRETIAQCEDRMKLLASVPGLENLEVPVAFCGTQLDFDNLKHDQIVLVMKALNGGKWTKTPAENGTINYTSKIGEVNIRCYQGEPPPNCKVVEYLEEIPEQIIPAKTVTKRKLVCT